MFPRFVALAGATLCLAFAAATAPSKVFADAPAATPTPVVLPTLPPSTPLDPYARAAVQILTGVLNRQIENIGNSTTGQVTYFKRFDMQVQTGRNSYRQIHLHQGTVINPEGMSIRVGQQVQVSGAAQSDGSLNANTITINQ